MGVCDVWATSAEVVACCDGAVADAAMTSAVQVASDVMWALSGRRWPGECEMTLRPCDACSCGCHETITALTDGTYWRSTCGDCSPPQVDLGQRDVQSITTVLIDGVVLAASKYRLDEGRWLVRLQEADGSNPGWPDSQDLTLPTTAVGTWSVAFTYGEAPPEGGKQAAIALACQLYKLCGGGDCDLPANVRSAQQEGVSLEFALLAEAMKEGGRLGVPVADVWLNAVNPRGLSRRPSFVSVDTVARHRRV